MQTPIDFGKEFLNRLYDLRDADACLQMLAGDLVWITPEDSHHFLSEGAVLLFLRRQIGESAQPRYVDIASIKSSPSAENITTVAYEINLVSREDEKPLNLRCSMAVCRRGRRLEITFLHFSKRAERDGTEQLRDFVTNLPCGVMILACLDGQREEAIFYNEYFAHRLRYRQEEFARAMEKNPFFMASEEDRERIRDEIARARGNGGGIAANLRFYRRDGNSFYYRMIGAPAYQANGGTVFYCVFQETTGYKLTTDRLKARHEMTAEILRQVPEGICGIEYPADPGKNGEKPRGREPRVFFVSKNIPAMFGLSNSAFMKNILLDPCFGLEMTSITKDRLLASKIFDTSAAQAGSAGPVSCGIFRLKKRDGRPGQGRNLESTGEAVGRRPEEAAAAGGGDPAETAAAAGGQVREPGERAAGQAAAAEILRDPGPASPADRSPAANRQPAADQVSAMYGAALVPENRKAGSHPANRIELVARRVCGKDRTVRLYLFYYDREAGLQEMEAQIDRAMKMGRAGQEQVRAELKRAKESAARQRSEQKAAVREMQEKHDQQMSAAEDRLTEEKNRSVLLSRQLEEARRVQKHMAGELEEARRDAARRIRNLEMQAEQKLQQAEERIRSREEAAAKREEETIDRIRSSEARMEQMAEEAQQALRRAEAARKLLEEQLREAQERGRILEQQLQSERARRRLLEEEWKNGSSQGTSLPIAHGTASAQGGRKLPQGTAADRGSMQELLSGAQTVQTVLRSAASGAISAAGVSGGRPVGLSGVREPLLSPAADWMAETDSLKIYSAMDPAKDAGPAETVFSPDRESSGKAMEPSGPEPSEERKKLSDRELLKETVFSPEDCLRQVLEYGNRACEEKEIRLQPYRDSRLPAAVCGFGALLFRALCGLLENAAGRTRAGGTVSVHSRADRPSGGFVTLYFRVDDDGDAISPDGIQTIFEDGAMLDVEFAEDVPGQAKYGIFAAREAAALMGGDLQAQSGPGGTRFSLSVTLRVAENREEERTGKT